MFKVLSFITCIIEIILSFWTTTRTLLFLLKKKSHIQMCYAKMKLKLIIPCLLEQDRIIPTIKWLRNVFGIDTEIIIVTTSNEKKIPSIPTTYEVIQVYLSEHPTDNICLINYPCTGGQMVDQLNYAISELKRRNVSWDYVGIYNADSRPQKGTKEALLKLMDNRVPIIQQYSSMTSNIQYVSPLMKSFALYQTNYEIKTGLLGCMLPTLFCAPHVVGHGLFIRNDILEMLGGFPTQHWCEDIFLSFILYNRSIAITALDVLEEAEVPIDYKAQVGQHMTWFKTAFDVMGMGRFETQTLTVKGYWYLFQRLLRSLMWLTSSFFILFSIIYSLLVSDSILTVLSLSSFIFMCVSEYGTTLIIISYLGIRHSTNNYLFGFLFVPLARILSFVGPFFSFLQKEKKPTRHTRQ